MASHLDLEEQEQLAQIKHFWKTYGNLITAVLVIAALVFLGINGWRAREASQAAKASALYDELERNVQAGEVGRVEAALAVMQESYARTIYAQQAGLLAAKGLQEKGKPEAARAALSWVAEKGTDPGYRAIARLRLAAELLEAKSYDQALTQLGGEIPKSFEPLVADRKGDIYWAQGKRDEAAAEYKKAWMGLDAVSSYRPIVATKLNAAGVDPQSLSTPAVTVSIKSKQ